MPSVRVEAIHVGTELLTFKYNAHSVYLAESIRSLGLFLKRAELVNDDLTELTNAVKGSLKRADLVFVTGGLGPTFDDLTREASAAALGVGLKENLDLVKKIEERFKRYKAPMPPSNRKQAQVIEGAKVLDNDIGTAAGQLVEIKGKMLILLPGPPEELRNTLAKAMPFIQKSFGKGAVLTTAFHIAGYAESKAEQEAKPLLDSLNPEEVTSTILAAPHVIDLIFSIGGEKRAEKMEKIRAQLKTIFGVNLFGEDGQTLESAAGELLKKKGQSAAFAESCTGGLVAHRLTNIAGSSDYFLESLVTYSNDSKVKRLGVKEETLKKVGAVSAEVAAEMALGVKKSSGSDWGVSVTGICGPAGGSTEKPVGLVYFGLAGPDGKVVTEKKLYQYPKERVLLKDLMASFALDLLRRALLSN